MMLNQVVQSYVSFSSKSLLNQSIFYESKNQHHRSKIPENDRIHADVVDNLHETYQHAIFHTFQCHIFIQGYTDDFALDGSNRFRWA